MYFSLKISLFPFDRLVCNTFIFLFPSIVCLPLCVLNFLTSYLISLDILLFSCLRSLELLLFCFHISLLKHIIFLVLWVSFCCFSLFRLQYCFVASLKPLIILLFMVLISGWPFIVISFKAALTEFSYLESF